MTAEANPPIGAESASNGPESQVDDTIISTIEKLTHPDQALHLTPESLTVILANPKHFNKYPRINFARVGTEIYLHTCHWHDDLIRQNAPELNTMEFHEIDRGAINIFWPTKRISLSTIGSTSAIGIRKTLAQPSSFTNPPRTISSELIRGICDQVATTFPNLGFQYDDRISLSSRYSR